MANINEYGNFVGRWSKDGRKEAEQKFYWRRERAETPIGHVMFRLLWNVLFAAFIIYLLNPILGTFFGITYMLFKLSGDGVIFGASFILLVLNGLVQIILSFLFINERVKLCLYTLGTAIAATIGVITTFVTTIFIEVKVFDMPQYDASCAIYDMILGVLSIIAIVKCWIDYAKNKDSAF
ncbi:MAG: hypothetical protein IJ593_00220 [Lachnospiraceae bacterium]|nr:hypothetical protein [Lachnospiraceae bacterium]